MDGQLARKASPNRSDKQSDNAPRFMQLELTEYEKALLVWALRNGAVVSLQRAVKGEEGMAEQGQELTKLAEKVEQTV